MINKFDDFIGNEQLIRSLKSAITNHRVSHAYLFTGGEKLGKKTIARIFAKTLNCEDGKSEPCCRCKSCLHFEAKSHPDITVINTGDKKSISVDIIRDEINPDVAIRPYSHRYKIYIIEDADTMSISAQNALLKTLEEPNEYAVFLLIARSTDVFLNTIISRCVTLKLSRVSTNRLAEYAKKISSDDGDHFDFYCTYADGSIGKYIKITQDDSFRNLRAEVISILDGINKRDIIWLFKKAKALEIYKESIGDFLEISLMWYRDLMIYKETGGVEKIIQKDITDKLENNLLLSIHEIDKNIEELLRTKNILRQNANFQMAIEVLLLCLGGK